MFMVQKNTPVFLYGGNADQLLKSHVISNKIKKKEEAKGSKEERSRLLSAWPFCRGLCSTSPPGGNEVDGLPPVCNTGSVTIGV